MHPFNAKDVNANVKDAKNVKLLENKICQTFEKRFTFVHFLFLKKICQPFDFSSFLSENFKIVKNLKLMGFFRVDCKKASRSGVVF